jgi:hypothetical protein
MAILIDTSLLLASAFNRDVNHQKAKAFLLQVKREARIVPAPVLSELFYMTTIRINYARAVAAFQSTQSTFQIEALTPEDMVRMQAIMRQYADAEFDYADTATMALAERLNVTRIGTFDRRDFSAFRPTHTPYLELLP